MFEGRWFLCLPWSALFERKCFIHWPCNALFESDGLSAYAALKKNLKDYLTFRSHNSQEPLPNDFQLFSLIIMDYNIPYMNGLDVLCKANQKFVSNRVKFPKTLMMTGIEDPKLRELCFNVGIIDYFIIKPAPIDQFEEII